MNSLSSFVIDQQTSLEKDVEIIIHIGRPIDSGMVDLRFREREITSLLDTLHDSSHFNSIHRHENRRIYKYQDLQYIQGKHYEKCQSEKVLASETHLRPKLCLVSSLIEYQSHQIEQFPSQFAYHDIVDQTRYCFKYDEQIELRIICEKSQSPSYWKLELVILKENIYKDRLANHLNHIVDLIESGFASVSD